MSQVFEDGPAVTTERFVLLALADHADEKGRCYPSIAGLCAKTCMSDRGVQRILRRLEVDGWLTVKTGGGRSKANYYVLKTPTEVHPLPRKPRPSIRKTPTPSPKTPTLDPLNPDPQSPEPSITIINHQEPSLLSKSKKKPAYSKVVINEAFDQWWSLYPRKDAKASAKKSFIKACQKHGPEIVCSGMQWQLGKLKRSKADPDGNFCPMASTFLNQERFLDEKPQSTQTVPTDESEIPF